MFEHIIKRTFKIPAIPIGTGKSSEMARQLDGALMSVGFKLSGEALQFLGRAEPILLKDVAATILLAIKELIGDDVDHNVYFKDFPNNVPDTSEFWLSCIRDALLDPSSSEIIQFQLSCGFVNLLNLPKYGKYLHTYDEMVAAHGKFIPSLKNKFTILHMGKDLQTEASLLYASFAGSTIPLNKEDKELLSELAFFCLLDKQPSIPIRENRAIINGVRIKNNHSLFADTTTDILRLACSLSEGDITLQEVTKFKSFPRRIRREVLRELNSIIKKKPQKLSDVNQYSERWKRLGERLHPYEYPQFSNAQEVFAVARKDKKVQSLAGRIEVAFADNDIDKAISLLKISPGMLFRNIDRILRISPKDHTKSLIPAIEESIAKVSGRVLLSLREHLQNRILEGNNRIFANKKGTAWVVKDTRNILNTRIVNKLIDVIDNEVSQRFDKKNKIVIEATALKLAVPLSDKNKGDGFQMMPRGSLLPIPEEEILRFFIYWKEKERTTDFDLSAILLNDKFEYLNHLSYTNLKTGGCVHSGDITEAPKGASEFIDIDLNKVNACYIIPQVLVYSGESFEEVEESFFGFMGRSVDQKGKPFEPATVKYKFDVRNYGKVALPLVFIKDNKGLWFVKCLNLYMNGSLSMNKVEDNKINANLLARTIVDRDYITLEYLAGLMKKRTKGFELYHGQEISRPVTFIGLTTPEGLPKGSKVYTLNNLHELIPK